MHSREVEVVGATGRFSHRKRLSRLYYTAATCKWTSSTHPSSRRSLEAQLEPPRYTCDEYFVAESQLSEAFDNVTLDQEVEADPANASKCQQQLWNDAFWNRCRASSSIELKVGAQVLSEASRGCDCEDSFCVAGDAAMEC